MPRVDGSLSVLRDSLVGVVLIAALWLADATPDMPWRLVQIGLAPAVLIAVLLRRRWPASAVVISLLATCAAWTLGLTYDPFVPTGWCVLVLAERRGVRAAPWWMFASGAVLLIVTLGVSAEGIEDRMHGMLLGGVVLSAAWVLGVRTRQAQIDAAARSRSEERLRLARDVHDVLSHSLGAIGVRAGVTAHVTTLKEDALRDALREIEKDARGSLAELKLLLSRERTSGPEQTWTGVHPTLGRGSADAIAENPSSPFGEILADLASSARRAGIRATVEVSGDVDRLPVDVRTTLHRVAQEALTNVMRHASASSVSIAVALFAERVQLQVRDDGVGAGAAAGIEGHGLTGIRERAALMGGTVLIDAARSGFTVTVSLPLTLPTAPESSGA